MNTVREKFQKFREEVGSCLIERESEVELVSVALLAGEHLLLVGPPGSAKSLLLDSLMAWTGGSRFSVLLTKFSTLEDLVGQVSVQGLKQDQYRRIPTGKLPEADFAYIDEVFKGSPAILNTFLRIMNEGTWDNGEGVLKKIPLKLLVGSSNEYPNAFEGGKELNALFDRFLIRKEVRPVATQEGRKKLLWGGDHTPRFSENLSPTELEQAREEVQAVGWKKESMEMLEEILMQLRKEGISPSDRRQYKAVGIARASAWLEGSPEVEPNHLEVLSHVLWDDPGEQPKKCAQIVAGIANPGSVKLNQFLLEAEEVLASYNPKDTKQTVLASTKLEEIEKQVKELPECGGKKKKVLGYVRKKIKDLMLAWHDSRLGEE